MIELRRDEGRFRPGEIVEGTARWHLETTAHRLTLQLGYEGAGWSFRVVAELSAPNPAATGTLDFRFTLPLEPYSFTGALVSVAWRVQLVSAGRLRRKPIASVPITMSPTGNVIRLHEESATRWTPYAKRDKPDAR